MRSFFFNITIRALKENKLRATATLIGVAISVAMITVVLFLTSSIYNFMVISTENNYGDWSISIEDISEDAKKEVELNNLETGEIKAVGYGNLDKSINKQKPYLFLANMDDNMCDISNIDMIEGRMPKNNTEIVLPQHLDTNAGIKYEIGDIITIDVGYRLDLKGEKQLNQNDSFNIYEEEFMYVETKSYEVVGICKRPAIEPYMAAGYTALVIDNETYMNDNETYFLEDDYQKAKQILSKYYSYDENNIKYNDTLLEITGKKQNSDKIDILSTLSFSLVIFVCIGCYMLMNNTFLFSLRERTSHYEILYSVGATEKQMRRSAIYEGVFFGIIGIPTGIILGTISTKVALMIFGKELAEVFSSNNNFEIEFYADLSWVLLIIIISFIVIQFSIVTPAYKTGKIKAVKEHEYENISKRAQKKINKSRFIINNIFGPEFILANKNYKRNKNMYKYTIVSIVMSVVMFVTINATSIYAQVAVAETLGNRDLYDIVYSSDSYSEAEYAYETLSKVDGVYESANVTKAKIHFKIGNTPTTYSLYILDDKTFLKYIDANNTNKAEYFNENNPTAVAFLYVNVLNPQTGKTENKKVFGDNFKPESVKGVISGKYAKISINEYYSQVPEGIPIEIGEPALFMSATSSKKILEGTRNAGIESKTLFKVDNANKSYEVMSSMCSKDGLAEDKLENKQEQTESIRTFLLIMKIFAYGFIILLSIVAMANVFNTVSYSMDIRRFEFATLASIGMTPKSIKKMICYECAFLGFSTMVYAVPLCLIGVGLVFYNARTKGLLGYVLPIWSIAFSIVIIIAIIVLMMLYTSYKVGQKNPATILKNGMF